MTTKPNKCPQCGEMSYYHNEGISPKTGKPYINDKCSKCKHIVWTEVRTDSTTPSTPHYKPTPLNGDGPDWDKIRERKEEGMEWLNAKNGAATILAALISKGEVSYADWYETYTDIAKSIFGFQESQ